jgi:hypothetical protein
MAIIQFCVLLIMSTAIGLTIALSDQPSTIEQTPDPVILISPPNGAPFLNPNSVTFIWHKGSPIVDRYWLQIALDSIFSFSVIDSTLTDTVKIVSNLILPPYAFYWRVRAKNSQGWGAFSEVWRFQFVIYSIQPQPHPLEFFVEPNYPNPFNSETVIRYSTPARSVVSLRVYSASGQEVAVLASGEQEAGLHVVTFDGTNLPSGVYFCRFTGHGAVETTRMVLLR